MVTNQAHILELVKKCQLQDKSAQFDLYQKYAKAMFNVAFRIVKDAHFAEDVMQEAFLKAFTQLDRYNQEASFGSWLKRIVMNQSIDFYKKSKRLSFESFDDHLKVIKNSNVETEHEYDTTNWKVQEVLNQMNTLKESYRIILTLSLIEGFDNEEITEILQINSQQCRTTLSRAKESLRNKMKTNG
uniref:RNA polymerase sigma factor n=3 Tax=Flavobacterium sp. TaxID=239 RepID=UPI004049889B